MDDLRDQIKAWTDATATHDACAVVQPMDIIAGDPIRSDREPDHEPPDRKRSTRVLAAAAVLVVVVAATALAVGAFSHANRPLVTVGPARKATLTRGPGSPIVGGLKVQPGSVLIAFPFPEAANERFGRSWSSLLVVTGDPATVFNEYIDQFTAAGINMESNSCLTVPSLGATPPPARGLECFAGGHSSNPDADLTAAFLSVASPVHGDTSFATSISLTLMVRDPNAPPTTLSDLDRYFRSIPTTTHAPPTSDPLLEELQSSPGPTTVPGTGSLIAPAWMDPGIGLRVVKGSTLVTAAAPLDGGSRGWISIARLTGDPEQVMQAYLRQGPHDTIQTDDTVIDGHRVLSGWWDSPGGASLRLTAMQDQNHTWYLRINVQND